MPGLESDEYPDVLKLDSEIVRSLDALIIGVRYVIGVK